MKSTLKRIWNIVGTALVLLVVICAIFLMGSRLLGFRVFTVLSGSMEPTYSVGDLIYVKNTPASEIKVGDPITFVLNEELVVATHRVVAVDSENQCFYTKGDANQTVDGEPIHFNNVIGVPKFSIPWLGYVSDYIQHPPGLYIAIGTVALLVIAVFLPDIVIKMREADDKTVSDEEPEAAED